MSRYTNQYHDATDFPTATEYIDYGVREIPGSIATVVWSVKKKRLEEWQTADMVWLVQHIIAHSLGSALSGHILSNQPTVQPPLSGMEPAFVRQCNELFLFNTS